MKSKQQQQQQLCVVTTWWSTPAVTCGGARLPQVPHKTHACASAARCFLLHVLCGKLPHVKVEPQTHKNEAAVLLFVLLLMLLLPVIENAIKISNTTTIKNDHSRRCCCYQWIKSTQLQQLQTELSALKYAPISVSRGNKEATWSDLNTA